MEVRSSNVGDSTVAGASRRQRTVWGAGQEEALLTAFAKNPYPSFRARQDLASEMGLPESRIRVWFQNRRNRTREVPQGPEGSAGPSGLASQQRPKGPGARAQGRSSTAEGRTRLRTRLSSAQLKILLQAFEKDRRPTYAARERLAQETGLPEDTVQIWFQNRRARHPGGGGARVRGQPSLASRASPAPGVEEPEGPCHREIEPHAQDGLLPPAAASGVGVRTLSLPSPPTSAAASSPAAAQPSGPCHHDPEPHPVARNTCPVLDDDHDHLHDHNGHDEEDLLRDHHHHHDVPDHPLPFHLLDDVDLLLTGRQDDQQAQDTLDPSVPWEDIEPTLECPLDEDVFQALLLDLL